MRHIEDYIRDAFQKGIYIHTLTVSHCDGRVLLLRLQPQSFQSPSSQSLSQLNPSTDQELTSLLLKKTETVCVECRLKEDWLSPIAWEYEPHD